LQNDLSLTQFTEILAGSPPPVRQPRFQLGFSYRPRSGHVLAVPASFAAALEKAAVAQITARGSGALAFGIDIRFQDASESWSDVYAIVHAPHFDEAHQAPLLTSEASLLPQTAFALAVVAVDDAGEAITRRRGTISLGLFRNLSDRVRRAQNTPWRGWMFEQQTAMVLLKRERPDEKKTETIELFAD
jgi:hypothetical protein